MALMLTGSGVLAGSALLALLLGRAPRASALVAVLGCIAGAVLSLVDALAVLLGGAPRAIELPWSLPAGSLSVGLDPLSAFFVTLVMVISVPAAVFGAGYLDRWRGTKNLGLAFCAFNLLVLSMALVVTARNGMLFLIAWEAMTLASAALVLFEHEKAEVRSAGLRYLVAAHLSGACLLALFALLGRAHGMDFAGLAQGAREGGDAQAVLLFVLALLGFGTKAGFVPLHPWLPEAHPAAPSHVSAVMSGVMIATGIYGLLRVLSFTGADGTAFGLTLLVVGSSSAITGIAYALAQRDLKRALAYSSIENMGIVAIGLGLSMMAAAVGARGVAALATSGAMLHLWNHMLMKGSLFLCAGSVVHATHTRDVEQLGGLLRRMPVTGATFLVASAAIAALPPLGGFIGEWLILIAGFRAAALLPVGAAVAVVLAVLALIAAGALAAAAFARLFAIAFLGQPRSAAAAAAHEGGALLLLPPACLVLLVAAVGVAPRTALLLVKAPVAALVPGADGALVAQGLATVREVGFVVVGLWLLILGCLGLRAVFARARVPTVDTWGCGYAHPSARLQYTGSSFAAPLMRAFEGLIGAEVVEQRAHGTFSQEVSRETRVPDRALQGFWAPLYRALAARLAIVRRIQHGRLNRYLLQIVTVLVAGILWAIASRWLLP